MHGLIIGNVNLQYLILNDKVCNTSQQIYNFKIIDTTDQSRNCETDSNYKKETVELIRNRKYRILIEQEEGINIEYKISL